MVLPAYAGGIIFNGADMDIFREVDKMMARKVELRVEKRVERLLGIENPRGEQ